MYATNLPDHDPDADLVDAYLDLSGDILLEVFGYTDDDRDLESDLDELEARYLAVPPSLRRYAGLARHHQFVLAVMLGGAK